MIFLLVNLLPRFLGENPRWLLLVLLALGTLLTLLLLEMMFRALRRSSREPLSFLWDYFLPWSLVLLSGLFLGLGSPGTPISLALGLGLIMFLVLWGGPLRSWEDLAPEKAPLLRPSFLLVLLRGLIYPLWILGWVLVSRWARLGQVWDLSFLWPGPREILLLLALGPLLAWPLLQLGAFLGRFFSLLESSLGELFTQLELYFLQFPLYFRGRWFWEKFLYGLRGWLTLHRDFYEEQNPRRKNPGRKLLRAYVLRPWCDGVLCMLGLLLEFLTQGGVLRLAPYLILGFFLLRSLRKLMAFFLGQYWPVYVCRSDYFYGSPEKYHYPDVFLLYLEDPVYHGGEVSLWSPEETLLRRQKILRRVRSPWKSHRVLHYPALRQRLQRAPVRFHRPGLFRVNYLGLRWHSTLPELLTKPRPLHGATVLAVETAMQVLALTKFSWKFSHALVGLGDRAIPGQEWRRAGEFHSSAASRKESCGNTRQLLEVHCRERLRWLLGSLADPMIFQVEEWQGQELTHFCPSNANPDAVLRVQDAQGRIWLVALDFKTSGGDCNIIHLEDPLSLNHLALRMGTFRVKLDQKLPLLPEELREVLGQMERALLAKDLRAYGQIWLSSQGLWPSSLVPPLVLAGFVDEKVLVPQAREEFLRAQSYLQRVSLRLYEEKAPALERNRPSAFLASLVKKITRENLQHWEEFSP